MRVFYFIIGLVAVAIGFLGFALPGLPGTPFMLIALWAFARSSRRFHDWLYHHPWFGAGLRRFTEHRVVPTRVKAFAFVGMTTAVTSSILLGLEPWAVAVLAAVCVAGIVYLLRCPSKLEPPEDLPRAGDQQ